MKMRNKLLSLVMALAMMLSVASVACAANSDPNLTNYQTNYTYTVTQGTDDLIELKVVPANQNYAGTTFDSVNDLLGQNGIVEWSVVDGSTTGVEVAEYGGDVDTDNSTIYANAYIYVASDAAAGTASIEAKNTSTGATMNFTIVVNPATASGSVGPVNYKVYTDNTTLAVSGTLSSVAANSHYGNTNFPSALDTVYPLASASSVISGIPDIQNNWGSYILNSMTVNGVAYTNYTDANYNYYGWQYRVIRNNQIVPLSELVGMDDFALQAGDTVVLKYGLYGAVTF